MLRPLRFPHSLPLHRIPPLLPPLLPPPSDLRAALRLLHSHPHLHCGRISGLLANRNRLIADDEFLGYVRDGARAMSSARRLRDGKELLAPDSGCGGPELFKEKEAALCVILTNVVEVHDSEGCALGIAVYPTTFSWINHSCSVNACYQFVISLTGVPSSSVDMKSCIVPAAMKGEENVYTGFELTKDMQMNGNMQHYQQQCPMDALHPPVWAREKDGYNFITPENSLLSYDSANSASLHSSQLKMEP